MLKFSEKFLVVTTCLPKAGIVVFMTKSGLFYYTIYKLV